jgi:flagellar motor switch protein FliG
MKLLSELGRIDYLPRDYISNVASALRRKRQDNPRLNTEALPGSEVLITLLERSAPDLQSTLMRNLQRTNPDTARNVKAKLVTVNTLEFLKDSQMLEVVLSLRHDELVGFLKGVPEAVRKAIYSKAPKDLAEELDEEVQALTPISKDAYQNLERRVINRIKLMANDGQINLTETNDRLFHDPMTESTRIMRGA